MNYVVKYQLHFHTFNKKEDGTVSVENGLSFFDGERNCTVLNEADAFHYIKTIHKQGEIEKLFDIPQEVYDSEYGEIGATSLTILRCYIG